MTEDPVYDLISLFCEAGLDYWSASKIARQIDRERWGSVSAGQLAGRLRVWRDAHRDAAVARAQWAAAHGQDLGARYFLPDVEKSSYLFTLAPKKGEGG